MNPQFSPFRRNTYHVGEEDGQGITSQTSAQNDSFHEASPPSNTNPSVEQLMAMMMTLMQGMQQTHSNQGNQGNSVAPFKLTVPEPYNGTRSPKVIDTWLFTIQEYCDLAKILEHDKVSFAASLLRDNAKAWWRSLHLHGKIPKDFNEFENELRLAFRPSDAVRSARNQLAALQQRGSVQTYVVRFRDLALEIPDLSAAEALDRFVRGLRDKTRLEVEHRDPKTLEDAINIAERYDSIIFSQRPLPPQSWKPFHNPLSSSGPTPMEVDVLNTRPQQNQHEDPEKMELRKKGACFFCKRVGHIARYCPEKSKRSNQAGNANIQ
jgi:hypothetical protein